MNQSLLRRFYTAFTLAIFLTAALPSAAADRLTCDALFSGAAAASNAPGFYQRLKARVARVLTLTGKDSARSASEISAAEFHELEAVSAEIEKMFPPETHLYVGVGRSPTPFMAYFEAKGFTNLVSLPLSAMRNHPDAHRLNRWRLVPLFDDELSPKLEAKLFAHFSRFLPTPAQIGRRSLVLIDITLSGASLAAAEAYVTKYYRALGSDVTIEILPIADQYFVGAQVDAINHTTSLVLDGVLSHSLSKQLYDPDSPFGRFNLRSNIQPTFERNPRYDALVREFSVRLTERPH